MASLDTDAMQSYCLVCREIAWKPISTVRVGLFKHVMFPRTEPKTVRRSADITAIALTILAGWLGYLAVSYQITGTARYPSVRSYEIVTREASPPGFVKPRL
jgi:hypothetical protein